MLPLGKRSSIIISAILGLAVTVVTLFPLHPALTHNPATAQDGGIQTYTIPHCAQPPANVDLSTLPDRELAQYSLPPRPTNGRYGAKLD